MEVVDSLGPLRSLPVFSNTTVKAIEMYSTFDKYSNSGINSRASLAIQNMFRFGGAEDERLVDVFFDNDPWDSTFKRSHIHFIGDRAAVNLKRIVPFDAVCRFRYPIKAISAMKFTNELAVCRVPRAVSSVGIASKQYVELDLIHEKTGVPILESIRLHRPAPRHYFNYAIATMIVSIRQPTMKEWIAYNIMIGIEHFYLFYNGDEDISLDETYLKYYIENNIVTLTRFPFSSCGQHHWNNIQLASFQTALQKYGPFTKWMGFIDIDEFLVPTVSETIYGDLILGKFVPDLLANLSSSDAFDCQKQCFSIDAIEAGGRRTDDNLVATSALMTLLERGRYFDGSRAGHGKAFYSTERTRSVPGIHHCGDFTAFFQPEFGAMFLHFDDFRYDGNAPKTVDRSIKNVIKGLLDAFVQRV
jgi:hypothetical protein